MCSPLAAGAADEVAAASAAPAHAAEGGALASALDTLAAAWAQLADALGAAISGRPAPVPEPAGAAAPAAPEQAGALDPPSAPAGHPAAAAAPTRGEEWVASALGILSTAWSYASEAADAAIAALAPALPQSVDPGLAGAAMPGREARNGGLRPIAAAAHAPQTRATAETAEEGILASAVNALSAAWSLVTGAFEGATSGLAPSARGVSAKRLKPEDAATLWDLLDDVGYKMKEITTVVGVIPEFSFKFNLARELSEADKEWIENKLERLAAADTSIEGRMGRMIVHAVLDINDAGEYLVEDLLINFLPLPRAEFTLIPLESPLSDEHDALLRAIQKVGREAEKKLKAE
ncbi:MAG: hypothetical protein ACT4P2_11005 [Pseudomonadota bacterium]